MAWGCMSDMTDRCFALNSYYFLFAFTFFMPLGSNTSFIAQYVSLLVPSAYLRSVTEQQHCKHQCTGRDR